MEEKDLGQDEQAILRGVRALKELALKEQDVNKRQDMNIAQYEQTWAHMGNYVLIAKDMGKPQKIRDQAELVARLLEEIANALSSQRKATIP